MIVNDKSKFERDFKLARAFFVFLAIANLGLALTVLHGGQCSTTAYIFGIVCLAFGPYPTGLLMIAVSIWIINFSFSKEMRERLAKHYT
ncbi:MAG: hypothetical protein ACYC1F_05760 [Gallionellaceae bacterium]